MFRKKLAVLAMFALLLAPAYSLATAPAASAAVDVFGACNDATSGTNAGQTEVCSDSRSSQSEGNPIIKALRYTLQLLGYIIGFVAVIVLIIGGFNFITSGGDPNKVANARNTIIYALIGLAVAVVAELLVAFVLNIL